MAAYNMCMNRAGSKGEEVFVAGIVNEKLDRSGEAPGAAASVCCCCIRVLE